MSEGVELTPKQQRFVEEYLVDLNATQAAVRAGYSPPTAQEQGSRLLSNVMVQQAVAQAQADRSRRTQVTQDRVVRELAILAFSDVANYLADPETGTLTTDAEPSVWRAISSVKRKFRNTPGGRDVEVEFRLWPKVESLKLLGQHLGMFREREPLDVLLAAVAATNPELARRLGEALGRLVPGSGSAEGGAGGRPGLSGD